MRRLILTTGILISAALGLGFPGDEAPVAPAAAPKPVLSTQADAVRLARAHVDKHLLEHDRRYTLFLWVRDAAVLDTQAGDLVVHLLSDRSKPYPMPRIAGGYLLQLDVRKYANGPASQQRWLDTLRDFRFDPAFNRLLVGGSFLIAEHQLLEVQVLREGRTHLVQAKELAEGEIGLAEHPGVPQAQWRELQLLLHTETPIISLEYFLVRSMTAIQDQFGSAEVYGGRYYQFTGIGDEADFGKFLGLGDGGDLTAFYDRLPSERRVGMWKSRVTGKERRVDVVPAEATTTGSWRAVTQDPADGSSPARSSAMRNLVTLVVEAREGITASPLGLHWFDLQNGQGKRQDEAPNKVVSADMVFDRFGNRNPHSTRLQPAISCIACHWAADDSDGWKELHNDVLAFLNAGFYPLTDLDLHGRDFEDARLKLLEKYQGEPAKLVARAKDDLSEAVLRCTGPWPGGDGASEKVPYGTQKDVVKLASRHLLSIYNRHVYEPVDARMALRELGIEPPKDLGVKQANGEWTGAIGLLRAVVPPRPVGAVEDPAIKALHLGQAINRFDFDVCSSFMAERIKR